MNAEQFNKTFELQFKKCEEVLLKKSEEYSSEIDRLHNFKRAADLQSITYISALSGMMAKHTISIYDMCTAFSPEQYSKDLWDEKITDSINYLILLQALLSEAREESAKLSIKNKKEVVK